MKEKYFKKFNIEILDRDPKWKKNIAKQQKKLAKLLLPSSDVVSSCPICRKKDFSKFCEVFNYKYLICNDCDHIFSENVIEDKKIKDFYDSRKEVKSTQSKIYMNRKNYEKRIKMIATPKVKYVNDILKMKGNNHNEVWIDIGAGVGEIMVAAQRSGWNSIGYETDKEQINFAESYNLNIKNKFLDERFNYNEFKNAKIISMINVLEHTKNPRTIIEKISRSAKKDSYIAIEVPRHPSLSSYLNLFFPENSHRHIYPPDHFHIFSDKSIKYLLSKFKFKIISKWFFGQDFSDLFQNLALQNKNYDANFNLIMKNANNFQKVLDKNYLSDTMFIIAKK